MKIKKARKVIRKAFEDDPESKDLLIIDLSNHMLKVTKENHSATEYVGKMLEEKYRDKLATEIIDLIFGK